MLCDFIYMIFWKSKSVRMENGRLQGYRVEEGLITKSQHEGDFGVMELLRMVHGGRNMTVIVKFFRTKHFYYMQVKKNQGCQGEGRL